MATATAQTTQSSVHDAVTWQKDGWTIALVLQDGVIKTASLRWDDPACDAPFVTALEECLEGMGLREARDHGVQHACAIVHGEQPTAISGILMPSNYSKTSRGAVAALRAAIDPVLKPNPTEWNFEDHGLSDRWRAIPKDLRHERLDTMIAAYLKQESLPDAVDITEIDQYDRVFLQFETDFPVEKKPSMLMQLERHLRQLTGERIELFVSEMKDNNRIRRL